MSMTWPLKTRKCLACSRPISSGLGRCPYCGEDNPPGFSPRYFINAAVSLAAAMAAVASHRQVVAAIATLVVFIPWHREPSVGRPSRSWPLSAAASIAWRVILCAAMWLCIFKKTTI